MKKNNPILEVRNLNKIFVAGNRRIHAVNDVSFNLNAGETLGLIGESGSGKTTLGRTLIRLNNATSGQVLLNDTNISRKKISRRNELLLRKNIQMIFQDPYSSLNEQMNIASIVAEPIKILKLGTKYLNDFAKDYDSIIKFFKYTLISEGRKLRRKTNIKNLQFIKDEYKKLLNRLNTFTITSKEKWEEIEALIQMYFNIKISGNFTVTNNNLDLINNLFKLWKKVKNKYNKGIVDEELEKELILLREEIKEAKKFSKHIEEYYVVDKKLETIKKYYSELLEFIKDERLNEKTNILNIIESLNTERKNLAISARNSNTIEKYNLFEIESVSKLLISKLLRKEVNNLYFENITEKILHLEEHVLNTLISKFDKYPTELKFKVNNTTLIVSKNKDEDITIDFSEIWSKFIKENKLNNSIFETKFENDFTFPKFEFSNEQIDQLKLMKNKTKIKLEKLIKELEINHKNLSLKKPKSKWTNKILQLEEKEKILEDKYEDGFEPFIKEFKKIEEQRYSEYKEEKESLLDEISVLKEEVENKYNEKKDLIYTSELPFFLKLKHKKPEKLFDNKWNLLEKKFTKLNEELEDESKRIKKDIKLIYNIVTGKGIPKYKLKKYLVNQKVFNALEEAGLTKAHAFRYPHEFSGGMRQRVGIARAIISEPSIIIADEPIAALDLSIQAQIANLLKEMQNKRKMSMIFIAHDLAMVKHISDRILIIHLGRIVESGTTQEIFKNPIHPYTKNLIESMPDIANISKGFKNNNFKNDYLDEYTILNQPKYHLVNNKDHKVLATPKQFKKWIK